jgi:hypothetical protein
MPVYDILANQVLPEPITNYYRGKAIRQDQALRQKEIDNYDLKLDLEKRRVASQERQGDLAENRNKLLSDQLTHEMGQDAAKKFATNIYSALYPSFGLMESNPDGAMAIAYENLAAIAPDLPEAESKQLQAMLADKVITPNEFQQLRAGSAGVLGEWGLLESDGETIKDHVNYRMPDGTLVMARPDSERANEIEGMGGIRAANWSPKEGGGSSKPFTTTQYKAAGFALRVEGANAVIDELSDAGNDFTGLFDRGSSLKMQGWKTEEKQKFEQAKLDFINAKLRQESGAAISDAEYIRAEEQYFPMPGDSLAVLEQKRKNRLRVQAVLTAEAGGAYDIAKKTAEEIIAANYGDQDGAGQSQDTDEQQAESSDVDTVRYPWEK